MSGQLLACFLAVLRELGAGSRINGYNGGAWRGHFTAGLLFVRPNSSPTIRIERAVGSDIFINFRDYAGTIGLYNKLSSLGITDNQGD